MGCIGIGVKPQRNPANVLFREPSEEIVLLQQRGCINLRGSWSDNGNKIFKNRTIGVANENEVVRDESVILNVYWENIYIDHKLITNVLNRCFDCIIYVKVNLLHKYNQNSTEDSSVHSFRSYGHLDVPNRFLPGPDMKPLQTQTCDT